MRKIKPLGKDSFIKRILRTFGNPGSFELLISSREKKNPGVSGYNEHYDFHKGIKNAMLETEQTKAKTIMEYQMRNAVR